MARPANLAWPLTAPPRYEHRARYNELGNLLVFRVYPDRPDPVLAGYARSLPEVLTRFADAPLRIESARAPRPYA